MRGRAHWRVLGLCVAPLLWLALEGCAGRSPAPIEDRASSPAPTGRVYRVQPGDTLYSIAWRYGLDYPRLAAANNIAQPFTIFVGQRLELREADPTPAQSRRGRPAPRQARSPAPSTEADIRSSPAAKPAPAEAPPARPTPEVAREPTPANPPLKQGETLPEAAVGDWRWPADGPVVRRYSSTLHKGIDIGGEEGDPVVAVAPGQVVYAGTGIPGYGELLIVRHNARYLSAYGHNDRLLVSEGDIVRAGQKIATRGSSGTNAVKLHFEIRENGKPIDPTGLLPRR